MNFVVIICLLWQSTGRGADAVGSGFNAVQAGVQAMQVSKWDLAEKNFSDALAEPGLHTLYATWYLGQTYQQRSRYQDAIQMFKKVLLLAPPFEVKHRTQFAMAQVYASLGQWGESLRVLGRLERSWRGTDRHPEVLWQLVKGYLFTHQRTQACRYARKLYANYPAHPLVYDWTMELQNAVVEKTKLGCLASGEDQRRRLKRLQWAGESERARKELEVLKKQANAVTQFSTDMMLAGFLVNDGYADEALTLLMQHYEGHKSNFKFLIQMAGAAARAGEFQTAVGLYDRAHRLSPNSRKGREALFQAAFLSYQFQDYDGAARKFESFIKSHARSGLARDARWHLAWIRYLRGDYTGALTSFQTVAHELRKRRRQATDSLERLRYWTAMSYNRLEQFDKAREEFQELIKLNAYGYYAQAARARLARLPAPTARAVAQNSTEINSNELAPAPGEPASASDSSVAEEAESEENLSVNQDSGAETESTTMTESDEATAGALPVAESEDEERVQPTDFKDPRLRQRFLVAKSLIAIGLNDVAKMELWEIERRTRNPLYLRMLMSSYDKIQSYNRASVISELYFTDVRNQQGIESGRQLWEFMYPKGFADVVQSQARKSSVPVEFIWSIMRAESIFKPDVVSPVGAKGLMQLMPGTALQLARLSDEKQFRAQDLFDPSVNIKFGTRYLARLLSQFKNNLALAAAAYNAGPHRVESWLVAFGNLETDEFVEHIPFLETRNYVKKAMKNYSMYRQLYAKDKESTLWLAQDLKVPIPNKPSRRENWESL